MSDSARDTKVDFQKSFSRNFFSSENREYDFSVAAVTHPGKVRARNEDHYAVIRRTRNCEMLLSNLPDESVAYVQDHAYGILVADGIGGAEFGDFASQLAIETTLQAAGLATSWLMKFKDLDAQEVRRRVAAYVDRIQEAFMQYVNTVPGKRRMGTTLTAAYLLPPHALIAHIGDSRAYLLRQGCLAQITRDQTLAQVLIDSGSPAEDVQKFGHVLMNCLGSGADHVDADTIHVEMEPGDRMMLCTDGLSDLVDPETMADVLGDGELQTVCDRLVELAMDAGGKDNITVVVCEILSKTG